MALAEELRHAGERPIVLASGGHGRVHVFCRLGPDKSVWVRRCGELGLDVRRWIRPPMTPHRLRGRSSFISPTTARDAARDLAWRERSELPAKIWHAVKEGVPVGSRSQTILSVALSMVNHGWSFPQFENTLLSRKYKLSEKLYEMSPEGRNRYLRGRWEKAVERARLSPAIRFAQDGIAEVLRMRAVVWAADWPGRTDKRNRRVLHALLEIAIEAGGAACSFSHRQAAERSGYSRPTVDSALAELQREGWLKLNQRGRGKRASDWRLRIPNVARDLATSTVPSGGCEASGIERVSPSQDAFRHSGLGSIAWEICRVSLVTKGVHVAELARWIGRSWQGTKAALVRMEAAGLFYRNADKEWFRVERDLDEVADVLGTAGISVRQAQKHQLERELYEAARKERAAVPVR
jgi:predicted transcriptional regulator